MNLYRLLHRIRLCFPLSESGLYIQKFAGRVNMQYFADELHGAFEKLSIHQEQRVFPRVFHLRTGRLYSVISGSFTGSWLFTRSSKFTEGSKVPGITDGCTLAIWQLLTVMVIYQ